MGVCHHNISKKNKAYHPHNVSEKNKENAFVQNSQKEVSNSQGIILEENDSFEQISIGLEIEKINIPYDFSMKNNQKNQRNGNKNDIL